MTPPPGSPSPLPPWLRGGGTAGMAGDGGGGSSARQRRAAWLRRLRGPALLLAGIAAGWLLHTPPPAPPVVAVAPPEPPVCPPALPCGEAHGPAAARPPHPRGKPAPHALIALPAEGAPTEASRRDALRAFAQQKADDLRGCLGDPGRGALKRVGAALEIDARGGVAAVQILGGDGANRALDSCYAARLKAWRFPEALLQGDERLLVNFVL